MIVLGIRPDIINLYPIVKELQNRNESYTIVHTGQHYSFFFDELFFRQLNFPKPDYHLQVGSGTQAKQAALLFERFEKVLRKEKPDIVFSFSDANPSLAGIVASKMGIKVAHLEAGMRSYDWRMPEEKNRRLMDGIADYLFTPTIGTEQNLLNEGIPQHRIFRVGKLILDVLHNFKNEIDGNDILENLGLDKKEYFLVTAHRPENVGIKTPLRNILEGLGELYRIYGKRVIFPIHPRTRAGIKKFGLRIPKGIELMDPVGFLEFSKLEKNALCCVTDSGTVQEDSCIFRVPCVTMRVSTERSETVEVGSNIVAGLNKKHIVEAIKIMMHRKANWKHPYGKPECAKKIIGILKQREREILSPKVWWDHPKIKKDYVVSSYRNKWKNPLLPDAIFDNN